MGMPGITNGGPERARKWTLGEREGRSCKHRIKGAVNSKTYIFPEITLKLFLMISVFLPSRKLSDFYL